MRRALCLTALLCLATATVLAQDPIKVDAKHYKVEFENDRVRVLRIHYGPHEKSVLHYHPESVAVFLTDQVVKFTTPEGKAQEVRQKAGDAAWIPAGKHLPENLSDEPLRLVLVEQKGRPAKAKPATTK